MFLQEFTPFPPPKSDSDNDKVHGQNWTLKSVVTQLAYWRRALIWSHAEVAKVTKVEGKTLPLNFSPNFALLTFTFAQIRGESGTTIA